MRRSRVREIEAMSVQRETERNRQMDREAWLVPHIIGDIEQRLDDAADGRGRRAVDHIVDADHVGAQTDVGRVERRRLGLDVGQPQRDVAEEAGFRASFRARGHCNVGILLARRKII